MVETVNRGEIHIEEVDLDGLVRGVVQRGLLRASTEIAPADVFVIAVPTPFVKDGSHTPDISYVMDATTSLAAVLKKGDCVILEATSPVGTTEALRDRLAALRPDLAMPGLATGTPDVSIAYCPERVLPGRIVEELTNNDRSIGGITPRCARKALAFYKLFVRGTCVTTDARSAEMTKLVENAYRDVNIAFANELSMIAERMNLDVWEVIRLANRHPRVNILQPGPGVGGHCIAVDPWFIVHGAPQEAKIIRTAREVNDAKMVPRPRTRGGTYRGQPRRAGRLPWPRFQGQHRRLPREPRALRRCQPRPAGSASGCGIVEPYARRLPIEFTDTGATLVDVDTALETCGLFVLLVDHDAFRSVPAEERSGAVVFDTRGIWPNERAPTRPGLRLAKLKRRVKHLPSQKARQKTKAAILTCWPIAYLKFVETPWDFLPKF